MCSLLRRKTKVVRKVGIIEDETVSHRKLIEMAVFTLGRMGINVDVFQPTAQVKRKHRLYEIVIGQENVSYLDILSTVKEEVAAAEQATNI